MIQLPSDFDTEILPSGWVDSNSLYPEYPVLTWKRVIILLTSALFFKCIQIITVNFVGIPRRRAFKVASIIHSCTTVTGSLYVLINYDSLFAYPTSMCKPVPYADVVLSISVGYFCYDLYKTLTEEPGMDFIIHGGLSIIIFSSLLTTGSAQHVGLMTLLFESSTIFLHLYAFMHYAHYNYAASIIRFVFALLFFVVRIIFGSYATIQILHAFVLKPTWMEWNCVPWYKYTVGCIINLCFHVLNIYWFRLIVNKALKVWRQGQQHVFEKPGETLEFDKRRETQRVEFHKAKNA